MNAFPVIDVQNGEPELAPGRYADCTPKMVEQSPGPADVRVIPGNAQQPHGDVVEGCAKYSGLPFCVPGWVEGGEVRSRWWKK